MKEKILKLRSEGKTYNEIEKMLGCSKSTISYHCSKFEVNKDLIKLNTEIKNESQIKDSSFLLPENEIINKIISLRKQKIKLKEISKKLEISIDVVRKVCRKYNLSNFREFGSLLITKSNTIPEDIKRLYEELKSTRKVSKELGISRETVRKYANIESKKKMTDDELRLNAIKGVTNWRRRTKKNLIDYKGGKCEKCGYDKCVDALEFHHLDPSKKDFSISGKSWSYDRLKIEVDKCILVCSNCHKEIHFEIKQKMLIGV